MSLKLVKKMSINIIMSDSNTNIKVPELKVKIVEVQKKIQELVKQNKTDLEIEMFFIENDSKFYEQYPYLVKKIIKGGDMSFLNIMLENLQKVEEGEQTLASTELKLGEDLAQQYLYPNVKKD